MLWPTVGASRFDDADFLAVIELLPLDFLAREDLM